MTAPALPGAAPDPARLPPEVEEALSFALADAPARGTCDELLLRTAIARALGGDGEPAGPNAKSMIEAIRLIGVTLGQDDDWVDHSPALVEFAAERIRSLYTRPAATRAEVERAVAALSARVAKLEAALTDAAESLDDAEKAIRDAADELDDDAAAVDAHVDAEAAEDAAADARAALEEPCKGDSPEAAEEDKS